MRLDGTPSAVAVDEVLRELTPRGIEVLGVGLVLLLNELSGSSAEDRRTRCERLVASTDPAIVQREREGTLDVRRLGRGVDDVAIALVAFLAIGANDDDRAVVAADGLLAREAPGLLDVKMVDAGTDLLAGIRVELEHLAQHLIMRTRGDTCPNLIGVEDVVADVVLRRGATAECPRRNHERNCHGVLTSLLGDACLGGRRLLVFPIRNAN